MAEFVFTSPGAKFKEREITFVTRNVGVTTLGLVGETQKGPAFEPIFVQDKKEFSERFGGQSIERFSSGLLKYQLPYVANAYLDESNQLWVTRVLGLSGYDAGTAWAVTLSAGVDSATTGATPTTSTFSTTFENNTYLGVSLYVTGATGSTFSGFTKAAYPSTSFSGSGYTFTVISMTGSSGTVTGTSTLYSGTSLSDYENMVLAVIRSRATITDNMNAAVTTTFDADTLALSGNLTLVGVGDLFAEFTITASASTIVGDVAENYTVSLNPDASSFLPNVIGEKPKDKTTKIWTEAVYPDLIKKLDAEGYGYGILTTPIEATTTLFTDYTTQYKTPETPWVVSQLKGSAVSRLFKFISISDGDYANKEIKISIANINPVTLEFDVYVRDFYDTDANPTIYETFTRCTMIKGTNSYVAQRIGTSDGEYTLKSKYIMVEMATEAPVEVFPAGFEGIMLNNWSTTTTGFATYSGLPPKIFYKTSYGVNERKAKVYLGVSELGYSSSDGSVAGTGINQNLFNFNGWMNDGGSVTSGYTKSKGFHMDSGATGTYTDAGATVGQFEVGAGQFRTAADVADATDTYYALNTRKFSLALSGGFDGWNVHRTVRSYGDNFREAGIYDGVAAGVTPTNDFQAWETAIDTFNNPEEVTINLFATPGINWSDQNVLVKDTIEMIETERTDTLYVIDSPDVNIPVTVGGERQDVTAANDIVDLLDTADVDTSYAATYFPWIQIRDTQNNVNVYLPPTGEVVKSMAYTDNTKFPWFAPAGLNRGVTDAIKSKYKLSLDARDILYNGRINPLADFADAGTAIFGQKTLLVDADSALNRINVRRLLLQIKVLISNIAIRLIFEQNDQTTIDQFLQKATPLLDTIKRERGLYEFQIKMDDTNNTPETRDRNELFGEIFLKPTRSVEFIGITFTITPSGASFADVGA